MCCSSVPTKLHYVQEWLTVWNKSPFPSSSSAVRFLLFMCVVSSCLVSGCVSNPTPHPAVDAGIAAGASAPNGAVMDEATPARAANADAMQAEAQPPENQERFADTVEGDVSEQSDDVGPEDGGGSTEPGG